MIIYILLQSKCGKLHRFKSCLFQGGGGTFCLIVGKACPLATVSDLRVIFNSLLQLSHLFLTCKQSSSMQINHITIYQHACGISKCNYKVNMANKLRSFEMQLYNCK